MTEPENTPADRETTGIELARRWNVSDRTIKQYKAKGAPLHDDAAMVAWAAGIHDLPKGMQTRLNELRAGARKRKPAAPDAGDHPAAQSLIAEFESKYGSSAEVSSSDSDHLKELKRQRAFALFKLNKAQEQDDPQGVADAMQLLKLIAPTVHDEELRSLKLNRELGDTVPVSEQNRTARALAYWLMRGADSFLTVAAKRISDSMHGGVALSPEEVRKILDPLVIEKRVVEPFAKAAQCPSGVNLSPRIVDSMRAACADFMENGEVAFDAIYKQDGDAKT